MPYHGDIHLGETLDFKFTTVTTTGAPTTLAGSPTVAAYVDNSTTELPITGALGALTIDFDGRTGLNHVRVVATAANGFTAGNYEVIVTAGTVAGTSVVGYVAGCFSIDKRMIADGLSYVDQMESILAVLFGKTAPSGSTVAFKKRDGTTTKVTMTYGTVDGERTASVIS